MKRSLSKIAITFLTLGAIGCASAQNTFNEEQAVKMLTEFYTAYNLAHATAESTAKFSPTAASNTLIKQLDSLQKKYCTKELRRELSALFMKEGLDHDILINDYYTDANHLNTLTVLKVPIKKNEFTVSYIAPYTDPRGKPAEMKTVLHVTVVIEDGEYKIKTVR
jgi:hypothetical protein